MLPTVTPQCCSVNILQRFIITGRNQVQTSKNDYPQSCLTPFPWRRLLIILYACDADAEPSHRPSTFTKAPLNTTILCCTQDVGPRRRRQHVIRRRDDSRLFITTTCTSTFQPIHCQNRSPQVFSSFVSPQFNVFPSL